MRNAFRIFCRDLKRILRNPAALLVIIGVSIIPSLYAWFKSSSPLESDQDRMAEKSPAAVLVF